LSIDNLLNAFDFTRAILSEALKVKVLNEDRQRRFPGPLLVICDLAELLWIHAEFSGHLDVGTGKMVPFANINPDLILLRDFRLFCHVLIFPFVSSAYTSNRYTAYGSG
jgi:hypothetical protein